MNELPHILVVDDYREIRDAVTRYQEENGMCATATKDAPDMDAKLATGSYDLIDRDVMMPGEETDRIVGLEIGADDYLRNRSIRVSCLRGWHLPGGCLIQISTRL